MAEDGNKPALSPQSPGAFYGGLLALLFIAPVLIVWLDQPFYLDLLTRVLIIAIAATSLNLIIGYGGMISLGHAAFIGIGAYCVGIPAYYDNHNGWLHLGLTIVSSGAFAAITGAISLRTRGLYFIMITLAFAQMLYFTFISLDQYGADDGLVIYQRSDFGSFLNLENATTLYYTALGFLCLALYFVHRLVNARFGRVIIGCKHNEARMQALGYNTFRYQLTCYIIAGIMCGISGFLLGNFTYFISPEMMDWVHSGELLFIVIIGGIGVVFGPLTGALIFLLLEEFLSTLTQYWHLIFGLLLIALVVFGKGGVHGLLFQKTEDRGQKTEGRGQKIRG